MSKSKGSAVIFLGFFTSPGKACESGQMTYLVNRQDQSSFAAGKKRQDKEKEILIKQGNKRVFPRIFIFITARKGRGWRSHPRPFAYPAQLRFGINARARE